MFYDRKVRYFSYYEAGERIKGSGFVKLEARDGHLRLELAIRGLGNTEGSFLVLLVQADKERTLGEISLREGSGSLRHECHMEFPYEELTAIRIPIANEKEVLCRLEEPLQSVAKRREKNEQVQEEAVKEDGRKAAQEREEPRAASVRERTWQEQHREEAVKEDGGKAAQEREEPRAASVRERAWQEQHREEAVKEDGRKAAQEREEPRAVSVQEAPRMAQCAADTARGDRLPVVRLQEDKWSQLCAIYPHIFPFRDERDYLSITPSDFVLLPSADYTAAHNSFLLHGYYNYQHLILTRVERRGESFYYLGVPGRYYEKEKQVAVMFNFESFECAEEPAEQGDFGYYMMRVKL